MLDRVLVLVVVGDKMKKWTYELAMAAAKDEANLRMRAAGRTKWNQADYNLAARTFDRLCFRRMEI